MILRQDSDFDTKPENVSGFYGEDVCNDFIFMAFQVKGFDPKPDNRSGMCWLD